MATITVTITIITGASSYCLLVEIRRQLLVEVVELGLQVRVLEVQAPFLLAFPLQRGLDLVAEL